MPAPLDRLLTELHSLRVTLTTLTQVASDHETRVRVLERQQTRLAPVLAALTFVLGALATELVGRWL